MKYLEVNDFATYMKKFPGLYDHFADVVCSFLPESLGEMMVVDVGVGPGFLAKVLQQKIPDGRGLGVDLDSNMLKKAQENTKRDGFDVVLSSADALPFQNGLADVVVSRFSLSYWRYPEDVFHEIFRVLKPGGVIVIEALNKRFSRLRLFLVGIRMLCRGAGWGVVRYHWKAFSSAFSLAEVEDFLLGSGFVLIGREGGVGEWRFVLVGKK